jgi:ArsR family metal-binding transcriptional regulator
MTNDKIKFTLNGEESVLAVDDGETFRPGIVSPSMRLTVSTLAPSNIAPPRIVFMNQQNNEPVMTIHPDGKITLGEKADPTEAAAACIEAMSGMIQGMIKKAVLQEQSK